MHFFKKFFASNIKTVTYGEWIFLLFKNDLKKEKPLYLFLSKYSSLKF